MLIINENNVIHSDSNIMKEKGGRGKVHFGDVNPLIAEIIPNYTSADDSTQNDSNFGLPRFHEIWFWIVVAGRP